MNNDKTIFVCSECGEEYLKWQGKCASCGGWNTLKDFKISSIKSSKEITPTKVVEIKDIKIQNFLRKKTGISEVDNVLGGGLVPGSVVLLAGEPGIGKSTLVMQVAEKIANVFYASGEESLEQIKMRAERLGIKRAEIKLANETNVDAIISAISSMEKLPNLIIIDSVQTMYSADFPSTAGSLVQVRESALRLQNYAKENNVPIILIGHVTKEGNVAGPKTLEHMVDVVLNLEGERYHGMRILRAAKNRFGATDEIGIFELGPSGMTEIKNPSKLFLAEYKSVPGSVVTVAMEGTRPLLVEIQALTSTTNFGYPKRTSSGFDLNRLQLIIAIIGNRAGINLQNQDVYLNVAGGFYLKEPAADLAVALAIISAKTNIVIDKNTAVFGELSLSGEIRPVNFLSKRVNEAKRLGFIKTTKSKNLINLIREIKNV